MSQQKEFLGDCIGVRLTPRGPSDKHAMVALLVEDDGRWNETHFRVSSHWLDETIEQLQTARRFLDTQTPDIVADAPGFPPNKQFGWRLK
jgi:hypothetical protein